MNPIINIQMSPSDKFLEISGWALIVLVCILGLCFYAIFPTTIPIHFNTRGEANAYGSRMILFILPTIAIALNLALTIAQGKPNEFSYTSPVTKSNAYKRYYLAIKFVRYLKLICALIICACEVIMYYSIKSSLEQI